LGGETKLEKRESPPPFNVGLPGFWRLPDRDIRRKFWRGGVSKNRREPQEKEDEGRYQERTPKEQTNRLRLSQDWFGHDLWPQLGFGDGGNATNAERGAAGGSGNLLRKYGTV